MRARSSGNGLDALGARLLRQQPAPRSRRARGDPRPPARVHRRRRRARRRPGRHVHRPRPALGRSPRTCATPSASSRRSSTTPASAACKLMIENCVMEGWHPDGYPGQPRLLAGAVGVDVRARAVPQLRPVAPAVARASTRSRRCKPYVDRVAHAHAKDAETFPEQRNRYGFFGRTSTREQDPWDMGWWRYRIPGLGEVDFRRYVDALYEGGFDGVLSVEHEDPVWGGTPEKVEQGLRIAHAPPAPAGGRMSDAVLEVRGLVKEYPGVKALQGVDLDVRAGEVHCLLGPNGAGKSTLIKCVSGAVEPTAGEILFDGEPLPAGDPAGSLDARRRDDLPGARPRRGPDGRREHLPRPRAAPRPAARPRQDGARRAPRCSSASATRGIPPRAKVSALRPAAQQIVSIARALSRRRAPADHGRAVGDPRRGGDRDAVRRRAPAHRRRRRRHLHLATASTRSAASATASPCWPTAARPPPASRRHADRRARGADDRRAASSSSTPSARSGRRRRAARGARPAPAARGPRREPRRSRAGEVVGLGGLVGSGPPRAARA